MAEYAESKRMAAAVMPIAVFIEEYPIFIFLVFLKEAICCLNGDTRATTPLADRIASAGKSGKM